jgi:hypothetical protein
VEFTSHVTSHCHNNLAAIGRRHHDLVLAEIVKTITRSGHTSHVNRVFENSILRPDIVVTTPNIIIDLTITFDAPESLYAGFANKEEKYSCLGLTLSFVIEALGSWLPSNDAVTTTIRIQPSAWMRLRRKCRLMAIRGSIDIISRHIRGNREMDEDPPSTQPSP